MEPVVSNADRLASEPTVPITYSFIQLLLLNACHVPGMAAGTGDSVPSK